MIEDDGVIMGEGVVRMPQASPHIPTERGSMDRLPLSYVFGVIIALRKSRSLTGIERVSGRGSGATMVTCQLFVKRTRAVVSGERAALRS